MKKYLRDVLDELQERPLPAIAYFAFVGIGLVVELSLFVVTPAGGS